MITVTLSRVLVLELKITGISIGELSNHPRVDFQSLLHGNGYYFISGGGGVPVPTSSDLGAVLVNGNSAGTIDIDNE